MKNMKTLMVSCLTLLLSTTISAQNVSLVPNWKPGDNVGYKFVQKDIKKSGTQSSTEEKSMDINLKVVDRTSDGYTLNATFSNLSSNGSDEMTALLLKLTEGYSFDYKLDASGKITGLADSTKAIADMKAMMDKAAKEDKTIAFLVQMMSATMTDDLYLSGILDEVNYIHSLNSVDFAGKKTADQTMKKGTIFGFSVDAPYHYTLQSVNGNYANIKTSAEISNDLLMPAFVDFSIKMTVGMMNGLSGLFQKEGEEKVDMNKIMQEQRAELEKKFKETFDLKIVDNYTCSYDKSTQWLHSMNGSSSIKGKSEDKVIDATTQVTIKKK